MEVGTQYKFKQERPTVVRQSSLPFKINRSGNMGTPEKPPLVIRQSSAKVDAIDKQDKPIPAPILSAVSPIPATVQVVCSAEDFSGGCADANAGGTDRVPEVSPPDSSAAAQWRQQKPRHLPEQHDATGESGEHDAPLSQPEVRRSLSLTALHCGTKGDARRSSGADQGWQKDIRLDVVRDSNAPAYREGRREGKF
jgi:hypothetical protein